MQTLSSSLLFFLNLAKAQSILTRRFDVALGGLSLSEFMILFRLSEVRDEKMRRIDLAESVGLTASGITRLLAPMEKIGLVKREHDEHDARVSHVVLAAGGRRKLEEALEDAELLAEDLLSSAKKPNISAAVAVLTSLAARKG
jgi:DNA-binding MarR family transcriptional regulator